MTKSSEKEKKSSHNTLDSNEFAGWIKKAKLKRAKAEVSIGEEKIIFIEKDGIEEKQAYLPYSISVGEYTYSNVTLIHKDLAEDMQTMISLVDIWQDLNNFHLKPPDWFDAHLINSVVALEQGIEDIGRIPSIVLEQARRTSKNNQK